MTSSPGEPLHEPPERRGAGLPSTEQLLVEVLVRSLHDALTAAEDPRDGRRRALARRQVELAFAPIWNRLPYLTLDVHPDRLQWEDATVLGRKADTRGLVSTLSEAGIRALVFVPGVEHEEIGRFLDVLDRTRRLDVADGQDLLELLFREDLAHLRYRVGPDDEERASLDTARADITHPPRPHPADGARRPGPPTEVVREAVREEVSSDERTRGIVRLEEYDSTLYFLEQKEIEELRSAIDREHARDHARDVLALLLDILELRSEPRIRDEVIGVLTTLMPYLLGRGSFDTVGYLIAEVRELARKLELEPRHKEALDALRVGLSETRALAQVFHALDSADLEASAQDLGILLRELRPEALRNVLVWIGQLRRPEAKAVVLEAVEGFFTEWPHALSRMLTATDRNAVHRALAIAQRLRLPEFVEPVAALVPVGEDPTTRRIAVRTLASIGTAAALRPLVPLVDDEDDEVRKLAVGAFAARPYRGALERLQRAIESGDLEGRDIGERRALFEAYGGVAGSDGVPRLERLLQGKGSFGRRASAETRACAAVALGLISTPAARASLEKATSDRDPVVRSAAGAALDDERR